jgi:hypothetical protein
MAHHEHTPGVIPPPRTRWIWNVFWVLLAVTILALPFLRYSLYRLPYLRQALLLPTICT